MGKITLVTGLWNIKRDSLKEGWSRSFEHYIEKLNQLLDVPYNLIIFGEEELREVIFKKRTDDNTQFIVRSQSWFKNEFYDKIQQIRNDKNWQNQSGWLKDSTQGSLEMYNPLVMSKPFLMHDAKILDKFDSSHLFWIDAGITNTVHAGYFTHDKVLDKLTDIDKITFVAFPYKAENEIHGFSYEPMCQMSDNKVDKVCRGGFFGGPKEMMSLFNTEYYDLISQTLNEGLMGTEESLFTILLYSKPSRYQYFPIESNGLINRFFEDLKNGNAKPLNEMKEKVDEIKLDTNNVGLYVITFNSPNQVKTLIKSMQEYDNDHLKHTLTLRL